MTVPESQLETWSHQGGVTTTKAIGVGVDDLIKKTYEK